MLDRQAPEAVDLEHMLVYQRMSLKRYQGGL